MLEQRLERVVLERMLAGVSARRSQRVAEPVGADVDEVARSTSKSAISRTFVGGTCADELSKLRTSRCAALQRMEGRN